MKKKQLLKEVFQQLELLNIEFIKMRERESLQKLMDKKITEILEKQLVTTVGNLSLPVIVKCGVLPDTEQNKAMNEFEDTSEPEPYIHKELTKEEEEAEFLAVQKQIDSQLKGIRDKQNKYNASNQNGV